MRDMDAAAVAQLGSKDVRMAYLVLVEYDAPYRLAFTSLLRNYDYNGDTFVAFGNLGTVTEAAASSDLSPAEYNITLSGVADSTLEAVSNLQSMNKLATVWAIALDEDYEPDGLPFIWFRGLTDPPNINIGRSPTVTIPVRNRITDWERPRISRYTDEEQQAEYPGDLGLEYVTEIATTDVEWPAGSWFRSNDQ